MKTVNPSNIFPIQGSWQRKLKYGRRYLFYLFLKGFLGVVQRLSFEQAQILGRTLGEVAFYLSPKLRRLGMANLEIAFGNQLSRKQKEQLLFSMFQHFGKMTLEWLVLPTLSQKEITDLIENDPEATERLLEIFHQKERLIILTPHFGNWELGGAWAAAKIPLYVVARRVYYEPINQIVVNLRAQLGMQTIYSRESPKKLFRALRDKAAVAILPDQHLKRMPGIWIPFFGKEALTITGPATLSLATQTPLVPMFAVASGKKYKILMENPIEIPSHMNNKSKIEKIEALTLAWTKVFEKYILQYPQQWAWIHRRWRPPKQSSKSK